MQGKSKKKRTKQDENKTESQMNGRDILHLSQPLAWHTTYDTGRSQPCRICTFKKPGGHRDESDKAPRCSIQVMVDATLRFFVEEGSR